MNAKIGWLFFLLAPVLLSAQEKEDFMGKWFCSSSELAFDEIRIQASHISEEKPLIFFYKGDKLWNRTQGSWNSENGVSMSARIQELGNTWSMRLELTEGGKKLQLYGKIRQANSRDRKSLKLLFTRQKIMVPGGIAKVPDKPKEPKIMQIVPIESDKPKPSQKASFGIRLSACKPCQQYVIHLNNDDYQKTTIPNKEGIGKFSQVPYGTYEIQVGWKGKMDRPDAPPYKKIKIIINKSYKKNYSVPLK